jgi:hypothetical protein
MGKAIAVRKNIALEMCYHLIEWTPTSRHGTSEPLGQLSRSESGRDRTFPAAGDFQISSDQLQQQGSGCWCRVGFEVVEDVGQGSVNGER